MWRNRRSWLHPIILLALLKISLSCIADEEFLCEEAVAHMVSCCSGFDNRSITCSRDFRACSGFQCNPHFTGTELTPRASTCIVDKSCERLNAGTCAALMNPGSSTTTAEQISCQ